MDFGKAFSFVFEDQDWMKKIGIGGVVSIVPILNFAATGYSLEVARRVINNEPQQLPEWDDIGGKLVKGLIAAVIAFVYMLPIILISCCMQVAQTAVVGGMAGATSSSSMDDTTAMAVSAMMICFSCLMLLYGIFAGLLLPAALGHYAAKGEFGAAFRFGEVFGLVRNNIGLYVMVLVINFVALYIIGGLGVIACVIGMFFTMFYAMAVMGHAMGQAYREASAKVGMI